MVRSRLAWSSPFASTTGNEGGRPRSGPIVVGLVAAVLAATLSSGVGEPVRAGTSERTDPLAGWLAQAGGTPGSLFGTQAAGDGSPGAGTTALDPPPRRGPFRMDLYARGDFVHQATPYWCVAASVQTMLNIILDGKPDRTASFQRRLHFQGRDLDQDRGGFWRRLAGPQRWRRGLHGLGLTDWTGMLEANGAGPYKLDRAKSRQGALRKAATAMRLTGKPAGLVVWRGAHAWVMTGFRATADPALTDDFTVTQVTVADPWYPDVSSTWGRSVPPGSSVTASELGRDFLRYKRPLRRHPMRDGKFMFIRPLTEPGDQHAALAAAASIG